MSSRSCREKSRRLRFTLTTMNKPDGVGSLIDI
jgi:hypothetical protein